MISLVNNKPLLVMSHHISYIRCSVKLTEMMIDQNAKFNDLNFFSISDTGKYCMNAKTSLSCAEEHTHNEGASLLIMDEEGKMLNNDEEIFMKEIISDGCTRGEKNSLIGNYKCRVQTPVAKKVYA